jgi:purine nucleoside phosphorylase
MTSKDGWSRPSSTVCSAPYNKFTVLVGVIGGSGLYHLDNLTFV